MKTQDMKDQAKNLLETAKNILLKHDGEELMPIAYLHGTNKGNAIIGLHFNDDDQKRLAFTQVRKLAELSGAEYIVTVTDAFKYAILKEDAPLIDALRKGNWDDKLYAEIKSRAEKIESVVAVIMTPDGDPVMMWFDYKRDAEGKIVEIKDFQEADNSSAETSDAWGKWGKRSKATKEAQIN